MTPIAVRVHKNIPRVPPDPSQQRSAGEAITASEHVSGTRCLSSFLHLPEDRNSLLYAGNLR